MSQPAETPPAPATTFDDLRRQSRIPIVTRFKKLLTAAKDLSDPKKTELSIKLGAWLGDLGPEANAMVERGFRLADALDANDEPLDWITLPTDYFFAYVLPDLESRHAALETAKGLAN